MHYKRAHNAVTKFTAPNASMSDTGQAANAFALPIEQIVSTDNSAHTMSHENNTILQDNELEMSALEQTTAASAVSSNDEITNVHQTCDDLDIKNILTHDLAVMISSLLSNAVIPRQTAQFLIRNFSVFLTNSLTFALQQWYNNGMDEDGAPDIDSILSIIKDAVVNFSSECRRHKYYKEIGTLIYPRQYPIVAGNVEFSKGLRKHVVHTGEFIEIRHVLVKFLSVPGVFLGIEKYVNECMRSSSVCNIVCSSAWLQTIQNDSNNVNERIFPLLLYYDEFETGNPLSSHAGIHKLGAVYTSIACLPPHLASQLKYIFLFALFYYSDRLGENGNKAAFQIVIDELNYLSRTGITLNIPEFHGTVKFKVGAIIGDNLGLHSILGFVEGFNAKYSCRICRADKELRQRMCIEDTSLLRNAENYLIDVDSNNCSITGIRHKAIWYALDDFDLFKHVAVDMMHDILEGVVNYTMTLVINSLVLKKYFTVQELNDRAESFDYGADANSKPPLLSSESLSKIKWKMSAIESLIYVRYFSCFISHKIPDNNEHWHLYILLRRIIDFAMTDSVNATVCDQLKCTVQEFNALYLKLSSTPLKPKFHHLIHYPKIMKHLGPLHNLWSMRFESKHKILKMAARSSSNRINLCKTLAIKHQLQLNNFFLENNLPSNFTYSHKIRKVCSHLTSLLKKLGLPPSTELYTTSFVKINGVMYRPKDILLLHFDEYGDPVFLNISTIFLSVTTKEAFFEGYLFKTVTFDPHVYAYLVEKTDQQYFVSYNSLIFVYPNNISILPPFGCYYITIRNSVD